MPARTTVIEREYLPAELAKASGVSTDLQRNWRRRGFAGKTEEAGWNTYSVRDVIRFACMRALTLGGVSLESAADISRAAILPVYRELTRIPSVVAFEGGPITENERRQLIADAFVGPVQDWLIVPMPVVPNDENDDTSILYFRADNLDTLDDDLMKFQRCWSVVISAPLLAQQIADKSPLPMITFRVERDDD